MSRKRGKRGYIRILEPVRCPECGEPMKKVAGMTIVFHCEPCEQDWRIHKLRKENTPDLEQEET